MITQLSISLRGAPRILALIFNFFNIQIKVPSWYTGRLWLMRLGFYSFQRSKVIANDWIWIADHSVQIGQEKALLILGIRQKDLPTDRPLGYKDLEPIDLFPVKKSNGDIVYEQLESTINKTGVPLEIISDAGSDLKSGIDKFCQTHSETVSVYDIKHKTAALLKRELEHNEHWQDFIALCSKTKSKGQQTELAFLMPPNQRSKARYMNVDILIVWAKKALNFIDDNSQSKKIDIKRINDYFGWLKGYRNLIDEWSDLQEIMGLADHHVRTYGLSEKTYSHLEGDLNKLAISSGNDLMRTEILSFVNGECKKAEPGKCLLGSSEIIESIFGKQKLLERDQAKSGFTGLILSLASFTSDLSVEEIQKAMETTSTKAIKEWAKEKIGTTVQSLRKSFLGQQKKGSNTEPIKYQAVT